MLSGNHSFLSSCLQTPTGEHIVSMSLCSKAHISHISDMCVVLCGRAKPEFVALWLINLVSRVQCKYSTGTLGPRVEHECLDVSR